MARPPNRSILLARAVGTLNLAAGFALRVPASAQVEINNIELEARNLRGWLSGVAADHMLSDIEARLVVLARRLAARGESPAAFDGRCIPALGVARRLNIPDIRPPRAWIAGRLARLGATRHFHHGLLDDLEDGIRSR